MSNQPILRPVSPLRRRMLEDMAMRGVREETQRDYLRVVSGFAAFLGRAPDLGEPKLGGRHLERTPAMPATCAGGRQTSAGAFDDQLSLELGEASDF